MGFQGIALLFKSYVLPPSEGDWCNPYGGKQGSKKLGAGHRTVYEQQNKVWAQP